MIEKCPRCGDNPNYTCDDCMAAQSSGSYWPGLVIGMAVIIVGVVAWLAGVME